MSAVAVVILHVYDDNFRFQSKKRHSGETILRMFGCFTSPAFKAQLCELFVCSRLCSLVDSLQAAHLFYSASSACTPHTPIPFDAFSQKRPPWSLVFVSLNCDVSGYNVGFILKNCIFLIRFFLQDVQQWKSSIDFLLDVVDENILEISFSNAEKYCLTPCESLMRDLTWSSCRIHLNSLNSSVFLCKNVIKTHHWTPLQSAS